MWRAGGRQEEKGGTDRGKLEKAKEGWMDEHSFVKKDTHLSVSR